MRALRVLLVLAALAVAGGAFLMAGSSEPRHLTACPAVHRPPNQAQTICPPGAMFNGIEGISVLLDALDGVESCSAVLSTDTLRVAVFGDLDGADSSLDLGPSLVLELDGVSELHAKRTFNEQPDAPEQVVTLLNSGSTFLIGGDATSDGRILLHLDEVDTTNTILGGEIIFKARQGCVVDAQGRALSPSDAFALLHRRESEL